MGLALASWSHMLAFLRMLVCFRSMLGSDSEGQLACTTAQWMASYQRVGWACPGGWQSILRPLVLSPEPEAACASYARAALLPPVALVLVLLHTLLMFV